MSFKIINPGYAPESNATQKTDPLYSNTGVSFRSTSFLSGIHVPYYNFSVYYLKFDLYIPSNPVNSQVVHVRLPYFLHTNYADNLMFYMSSNLFYYRVYYGSNVLEDNISNTLIGLKINGINTIYFVLSPGNNGTAYCYMIINNSRRIANYAFSDNISPTNSDLFSIYVSSSSYDYYVSNIILSDSPIDYSEKAIAIPISEVYTDMSSLSSNLYVADSVDQSLLASLDINSLLNDVSVNSKVTGIMVAGEPMYTTGVGEVSVISKSNDSVTEKGTIALSENSLQSAVFGWGTDITLNDLSNIQLGFKVR